MTKSVIKQKSHHHTQPWTAASRSHATHSNSLTMASAAMSLRSSQRLTPVSLSASDQELALCLARAQHGLLLLTLADRPAADKRELANLLARARSEAAPGGHKTQPFASAPAKARALLRSIAERLTQAHSRRMGQHEYDLMPYVDSQQAPGIQLQGVPEPQSQLV